MATRCCCPPLKLAGQVATTIGETNCFERFLHLSTSFSRGNAERHQRRLNILCGSERRNQIEVLEDEANVLCTQHREIFHTTTSDQYNRVTLANCGLHQEYSKSLQLHLLILPLQLFEVQS